MKLKTQDALASALGVTKSTISKYLARGDWPVRRTGPWTSRDVEKVRTWRAQLLKNRATESGAGNRNLTLSRTEVAVQRAKLLEMQNAILSGRYHDAQQCGARSVLRIHVVKNALMNLFPSVAGPMGLSDDQVRIGEGLVLEILRQLSDANTDPQHAGHWVLAKFPDQKKQAAQIAKLTKQGVVAYGISPEGT